MATFSQSLHPTIVLAPPGGSVRTSNSGSSWPSSAIKAQGPSRWPVHAARCHARLAEVTQSFTGDIVLEPAQKGNYRRARSSGTTYQWQQEPWPGLQQQQQQQQQPAHVQQEEMCSPQQPALQPAQQQNLQQEFSDNEQQQQPDHARRPCRDPALLTHNIQTARTLSQLQRVLRQYSRDLNATHVCALLNRAVEYASTDPSRWFVQQSQHQPARTSQHAAHSMHSTQQHRSWHRAQRPVHLDAQARTQALSQLRTLVYRTAALASGMAQQQQLDSTSCSLMLTALAKLGYYQPSVLNSIATECQRHMPAASLKALSNMAWAAAMLKLRPGEAWLSTLEASLHPHLRTAPAGHLSTAIYSLGLLQHKPSAQFLHTACDRCLQLLDAARSLDLANFCAGLARMRHTPSNQWLSSFVAATAPRLRTYRLPHLNRTLVALAALGCKPDSAWLSAFYESCRAALADDVPGMALSAQHLAAMTAALARMGCRPDMQWMDTCLLHSRRGLQHASPADLTQLLAALAALRYRPGDVWMQVFLTASFQHLAAYSPAQVVLQLKCLVQLGGQRPNTTWLSELVSKVQSRLTQYSGDELAAVIAALARMQYRPPASWLAAWEEASQGQLESCSANSLASAVWGLAQLGHQPAVGWLYSFVLAAYGRLDAFDSSQLSVVFEALPRVSPYPGWLDELVQICASEASPTKGRGLSSVSSFDDVEDAELLLQGVQQYPDDDSSMAAAGSMSWGLQNEQQGGKYVASSTADLQPASGPSSWPQGTAEQQAPVTGTSSSSSTSANGSTPGGGLWTPSSAPNTSSTSSSTGPATSGSSSSSGRAPAGGQLRIYGDVGNDVYMDAAGVNGNGTTRLQGAGTPPHQNGYSSSYAQDASNAVSNSMDTAGQMPAANHPVLVVGTHTAVRTTSRRAGPMLWQQHSQVAVAL